MKTITFFALFFVSACAASAQEKGPVDPVVRLGAVASLSGPAAMHGKAWLEGVQLAVEEAKAEGVNVTLTTEDDGTSAAKAASAFTKLASVDKVDVVFGGTWDFLAAATYPLAKRMRTPFVTPTNPVELLEVEAKDNPFAFTNSISLAAEREVAAKLIARLRPKRAAIIYIDVPYGQTHQQMMTEILREAGVPIGVTKSVGFEGMTDGIKHAVLASAQQKCDFAFVVLGADSVDFFMREVENMKYSVTLLVTQHLDKAFEMSGRPSRYEGAYGLYPAPGTPEFRARYVKRFGHEPRDFAPSGYDAAMFAIRRIHRGEKFAGDSRPFSWRGVTGMHSLPAANYELVRAPAVIMTVKDGVFGQAEGVG